jgi:hypothetical protein
MSQSPRILPQEAITLTLLEGTPEERGATLALAFRDDAARGMSFFSRLVGRYAALSMPWLPGWGSLALDALVGLLGRGVMRHYSDDFRRVLDGAAAADSSLGSGRRLLRAHASLDLLLMASALSQRLERGLLPSPACTCVMVSGEATANNGYLVGRNFDLPPYRPDAPPSRLVLERPSAGIPHLSLYHAPGYLPGISAINQEGLIVSVLMNFPSRVRWGGTPVLALSKRVIEEARTVEDARRILSEAPPAAGWTFFVADAARQARCFEVGFHGLGEIAPEQGVLFAANRYRSDILFASDREASTAWREHNLAREQRLAEALDSLRGSLDVPNLVALLGDRIDPTTQTPRVGPAIAAPHNTGSLIFAPEQDALFLSAGGWPSNGCGVFQGLSLSALFRGELVRTESHASPWPAEVQGAASAYVRATYRLLVEGDERASLHALDAAISRVPEEPSYRVTRGALRLRLGDALGAEADLRESLRRETWAARRAHVNLLLGCALDLQGARAAALESYRAALAGESKVALAAQRGLQRPCTPRRARHIPIDPVLATPA